MIFYAKIVERNTNDIAMSFGTAAVSGAVIAKAVLDIHLTLDKLYRDADSVGTRLEGRTGA